jgi:hypothetical protein
MRATLGPVCLNLLVTAAGMGVLSVLRLVEFSLAGIGAALGLAFLTGLAAIGLLLITALAVGVPYTATTVAVIALCIAVGGAVGSMHSYALSRRPPRSSKRIVGSLLCDRRLVFVFAVVFGAYAVVGIFRAAVSPLDSWDAWAVWTPKAVLLTDFHHIPQPFFTDRAYDMTHQNYPLFVPVLESMWFRFAGQIDTQSVHVEFWLLLVGFVWAIAYILARRGVRAFAWGPLLLLVALAPGTSSQLLSAYADIPMALFVGLGVLLVGLWISNHDPAHLALGLLFLAAAANTKNEGLVIAFIVLAVAAIAVGQAPLRLRLLVGAAGLVAAVLPWQLWTALNGVPRDPDIPLSKIFEVSYLLSRLGRIWPSLSATQTQFASQGLWLYIVPTGLAVILACLVLRAALRPALFYLGTGMATLTVYLWVYWASPLNLTWYLSTSDFRIVDSIVFIALAAILQLPTEAQRYVGISSSLADPPQLADDQVAHSQSPRTFD